MLSLISRWHALLFTFNQKNIDRICEILRMITIHKKISIYILKKKRIFEPVFI